MIWVAIINLSCLAQDQREVEIALSIRRGLTDTPPPLAGVLLL